MKTKWKEMSAGNKVMIVARAILSIAVIVLAVLQLTGILERAVDYAVPLLGIYLLILSIQEWKQNRGSAILSICLAIFIFICTVCVWRGK